MEEFEDDDDFGDLYTDVEVQASSAINCIQELTQFSPDHENSDSSEANANERVAGGGGGENAEEDEEKEEEAAVNLEEGLDWNGNENAVESDSDGESEDDLNIVLNEDEGDGDCKLGFQTGSNVGRFDNEDELRVEVEDEENNGRENDGSGGRRGNGGLERGSYNGGVYGAQYKRMRSQSAAGSNNLKRNGTAGVALYSSMFVRGNWEDNFRTPRFSTNSIGAQSGCNFSLPRSRTILDVNIDALEWKPWRHLGADITDFFNFGLDEDSWKCYCNSLDRCREQATNVKNNPAYRRHDEQHEDGRDHEGLREAAFENTTLSKQKRAVSPSHEISLREQQLQMPKGKAIQVEDSIAERQPSIYVRHPVERDSDVIIQIPVQDMEEELSSSAKAAFDQGVSHVLEASDCGESGDARANKGEMLCFSSDSEDEPSILEGPMQETGISNPERCFKHASGCDCNPASRDSDKCGSFQASDADKEHHEELADGNSDETAEAVQSSKDPKKSVGSVKRITESSADESESSHREESQHDPSLSPSWGHALESRDGSYNEPDKFHGQAVRASPNSVSEVLESVAFDYQSSKDSRSHSINMKSGGYKYLARSRSPIHRHIKFHRRNSSRMSELKSGVDYEDAFCLSDRERFHNLYHSTIRHRDQRNRHHGFDFSERQNFSYYQRADYSFRSRKKFCDYQSGAGNSHWTGHQVSEYERDQCYNRSVNGKHHPEQSIPRSSHHMMEKDWDHYERGDTVHEMESLDFNTEREFISEQSQFLDSRNHTRWKQKSEELNFRRMKNDKFIPECNYSNDLMRENCRPVQYNARERDFIQHKYDRQLPYGRRAVKIPVRSKRRYDNPLNGCETIWRRESEDEKGRYTRDQLSFWSYKEPQTVGKGRGRGSLSRIGTFERHSGEGRYNCIGRYSGSIKFGSGAGVFDNDENMRNPDDQDDFDQRRQYRQSEILQREEEYSCWYPDDNFQAEGTLNPFYRTSRIKRSDAKHGSGRGGKVTDHGESEQNRYKLSRADNSSSQFLENSNITRRGNVLRTLPRSWDSTDKHMIVWDRKSSRFSEVGKLMCYGRYEYGDSEQRTFKDLNDSRLQKVIETDNTKTDPFLADANWFNMFPDGKRNDSSDIEEGQIVTECFYEKPMDRISSLKARTNIIGTKNVSTENPRLLEIIAKMEKRRERFKEPITLKIVSEKDGKPFADKVAETVETKKLQRPARKRKWVGN
ncbi:hypothetical protein ACH5RR_031011 [Cinchona calisaya]|uniref:Pre-mRNA polyadenylation factor Fip1 domain-containing protein n=1 Tax=Cinchona calisaya TaxID=153742 RepID=A0ABD2YHZ1_9GENT